MATCSLFHQIILLHTLAITARKVISGPYSVRIQGKKGPEITTRFHTLKRCGIISSAAYSDIPGNRIIKQYSKPNQAPEHFYCLQI